MLTCVHRNGSIKAMKLQFLSQVMAPRLGGADRRWWMWAVLALQVRLGGSGALMEVIMGYDWENYIIYIIHDSMG